MDALVSSALSLRCGPAELSVRRFTVREALSEAFEVRVVAMSREPWLDPRALLEAPARLEAHGSTGVRIWAGLCRSVDVVAIEPTGLSTVALTLVPELWKLTRRRRRRLFQHRSIVAIAETLLSEWGIEADIRVDRKAYPRLEMRVQYDETDHDFLCRLLEEAGISFFFEEHDERGSVLVLHDRPQAQPSPLPAPVPFAASAGQALSGGIAHVTAVRLEREVRPGKVSLRDTDFRRPTFVVEQHAESAGPEAALEQVQYRPGAFLIEKHAGTGTDVSDDRGIARTNLEAGKALAERTLRGERPGTRVSLATNVLALRPGAVFAIARHPRADLAPNRALLVTESTLEGEVGKPLSLQVRAVFARKSYRPAAKTPRPKIGGVQSAVVVGPAGEEIYTDEFGRVRVQFPWDAEGAFDPNSSCWLRVSQGWAGIGYGMQAIPRVGHTVLVTFTEGNPDQPVVVGSLFDETTPVPYPLPAHRTVSTWKGRSSPGGVHGNELRFEDAAGREHVYLHAERDARTRAGRDLAEAVGHKRTRLVRGDETLSVERDRFETVGAAAVESTGGQRRARVTGDRLIRVEEREVVLAGKKFLVKVVPELHEPADTLDEDTAGATAGLQMLDGTILLTTQDATILRLVVHRGGQHGAGGRALQASGARGPAPGRAGGRAPGLGGGRASGDAQPEHGRWRWRDGGRGQHGEHAGALRAAAPGPAGGGRRPRPRAGAGIAAVARAQADADGERDGDARQQPALRRGRHRGHLGDAQAGGHQRHR